MIPLRSFLSKLLAFYLGCLGCYLLHTKLGMSPILSSSLLGFIITFIHLPKRLNHTTLQIVFYTGTFAGMSSPPLIYGPLEVLGVSIIGTVIFIFLKPHFQGIGGKMGLIAFLSMVSCLLLRAIAWLY